MAARKQRRPAKRKPATRKGRRGAPPQYYQRIQAKKGRVWSRDAGRYVPALTMPQAHALAGKVTRQIHEERGAVLSPAERKRFMSAAKRKSRGTMLALMAKKSRSLRKTPRGNAPDRYTISGRASAKGGPGGLVLVLAKTGSKTCAVRDANRARRWGYKNITIFDSYTKRKVGWRGK